jgi:hypothetical protein
MAGWLPAYRSQSLVGVLDRHGEGRGEAKANPALLEVRLDKMREIEIERETLSLSLSISLSPR